MNTKQAFANPTENALLRLAALAELDGAAVAALRASARSVRRVAAHREIVAEGEHVVEPSIVLSGWAARVRNFGDGRRQILTLLLPGDLIDVCHQPKPVAVTTVMALTQVTLCRAPSAEGNPSLAEAYFASGALAEAYLFRQIARIGRFNAYERLIDFLLETSERLALAGLASEDIMPMPLTQELLADALGLTSVHVNRVLQMIRREGLLEVRGGIVKFSDRQHLAGLVDYHSASISSAVPVAKAG